MLIIRDYWHIDFLIEEALILKKRIENEVAYSIKNLFPARYTLLILVFYPQYCLIT